MRRSAVIGTSMHRSGPPAPSEEGNEPLRYESAMRTSIAGSVKLENSGSLAGLAQAPRLAGVAAKR
jgi:hypothetical protein